MVMLGRVDAGTTPAGYQLPMGLSDLSGCNSPPVLLLNQSTFIWNVSTVEVCPGLLCRLCSVGGLASLFATYKGVKCGASAGGRAWAVVMKTEFFSWEPGSVPQSGARSMLELSSTQQHTRLCRPTAGDRSKPLPTPPTHDRSVPLAQDILVPSDRYSVPAELKPFWCPRTGCLPSHYKCTMPNYCDAALPSAAMSSISGCMPRLPG
jgi:hypothetical protein